MLSTSHSLKNDLVSSQRTPPVTGHELSSTPLIPFILPSLGMLLETSKSRNRMAAASITQHTDAIICLGSCLLSNQSHTKIAQSQTVSLPLF